MNESSPRRRHAAESRLLIEANALELADRAIREWIAAHPKADGRWSRAGVLGESGVAYCALMEQRDGGPVVIAAGYRREGLCAAMRACAAGLTRVLLAEPSRDPAPTLPAPPPTGLERAVQRYLDATSAPTLECAAISLEML